jgi:peptidyl-tRNA hydrolase, PTH1 family
MNFFRFFSIFFKPKASLRGVAAVILGIGNIGKRYEGTRHNVGFLVVDELAPLLKNLRRFEACNAEIILGELDDKLVALAKPMTFVNRSGESAAGLLAQAGLPASALWVVADDLNLGVGTLRMRPDGSDGGHNGLKSIIAAVGRGFPRLRLGIGPVPKGASVIDFVLGPFPESQHETMSAAVRRAAEALRSGLQKGIEPAMSKFNG